jgi:hypothetical protein
VKKVRPQVEKEGADEYSSSVGNGSLRNMKKILPRPECVA